VSLNNSDIIFTEGRFPDSLDLGRNLFSFGLPDVALGVEVMPGEVLHDHLDRLARAAEAAGQYRLLAQELKFRFDSKGFRGRFVLRDSSPWRWAGGRVPGRCKR
jgi:hypothetical protein